MLKKKFCSIAMVVIMTVGLISGCGSSKAASGKSSGGTSNTESANDVDTSIDMKGKPYTVNFMYLVAQEGSDQQKVQEAADALSMKELNMHVNLIPMTFGTYNSQISLMLSSGEALDIAPIFSSAFATDIASQYIVNLNDYKNYLKDAVGVIGEEDANAGTIAGFLTGLPRMQERSYPAALIVRKDILEDCGYTIDDFKDIIPKNGDYSGYDKITKLFETVQAKYPKMTMLDGTTSMGHSFYGYVDPLGDCFGVLENLGQGSSTVTNWFEGDEFKTLCKYHRKWFEAGYESKDIATNTDSGEIKMKAGNTFSYIAYGKVNTDIEKLAQTGYEVEWIPLSDSAKSSTATASAVISICNASEDKTKAAQFLNWAYTNGEFNDLINWGVKGTDWIESADGMAQYPEGVDASTVGYHNDFGWIYPNQFAGHAWIGNPSDIWSQYKKINDATKKSLSYGFFFDPTKVETEIAQLNSVLSQYQADVCFGAVDPDEAIPEFNKALYNAGLKTVMDEKQSQLDAWLAKK